MELDASLIEQRIIVTGSRKWTNETIIRVALQAAWYEFPGATLVHGQCRTGADEIADRLYGGTIRRYPADWNGPCRPTCRPGHRRPNKVGTGTYCPAAGDYRNADMVAAGAVVCLAFIRNNSPGATDCARRAADAMIPVRPYRS